MGCGMRWAVALPLLFVCSSAFAQNDDWGSVGEFDDGLGLDEDGPRPVTFPVSMSGLRRGKSTITVGVSSVDYVPALNVGYRTALSSHFAFDFEATGGGFYNAGSFDFRGAPYTSEEFAFFVSAGFDVYTFLMPDDVLASRLGANTMTLGPTPGFGLSAGSAQAKATLLIDFPMVVYARIWEDDRGVIDGTDFFTQFRPGLVGEFAVGRSTTLLLGISLLFRDIERIGAPGAIGDPLALARIGVSFAPRKSVGTRSDWLQRDVF